MTDRGYWASALSAVDRTGLQDPACGRLSWRLVIVHSESALFDGEPSINVTCYGMGDTVCLPRIPLVAAVLLVHHACSLRKLLSCPPFFALTCAFTPSFALFPRSLHSFLSHSLPPSLSCQSILERRPFRSSSYSRLSILSEYLLAIPTNIPSLSP